MYPPLHALVQSSLHICTSYSLNLLRLNLYTMQTPPVHLRIYERIVYSWTNAWRHQMHVLSIQHFDTHAYTFYCKDLYKTYTPIHSLLHLYNTRLSILTSSTCQLNTHCLDAYTAVWYALRVLLTPDSVGHTLITLNCCHVQRRLLSVEENILYLSQPMLSFTSLAASR